MSDDIKKIEAELQAMPSNEATDTEDIPSQAPEPLDGE